MITTQPSTKIKIECGERHLWPRDARDLARGKGQTRRGSLIEAVFNILVGVSVAFGSQIIIFHFYQIPVHLWQNAQMTLWFTGVSLVRSYVIRRWFNIQTI